MWVCLLNDKSHSNATSCWIMPGAGPVWKGEMALSQGPFQFWPFCCDQWVVMETPVQQEADRNPSWLMCELGSSDWLRWPCITGPAVPGPDLNQWPRNQSFLPNLLKHPVTCYFYFETLAQLAELHTLSSHIMVRWVEENLIAYGPRFSCNFSFLSKLVEE